MMVSKGTGQTPGASQTGGRREPKHISHRTSESSPEWELYLDKYIPAETGKFSGAVIDHGGILRELDRSNPMVQTGLTG